MSESNPVSIINAIATGLLVFIAMSFESGVLLVISILPDDNANMPMVRQGIQIGVLTIAVCLTALFYWLHLRAHTDGSMARFMGSIAATILVFLGFIWTIMM